MLSRRFNRTEMKEGTKCSLCFNGAEAGTSSSSKPGMSPTRAVSTAVAMGRLTHFGTNLSGFQKSEDHLGGSLAMCNLNADPL